MSWLWRVIEWLWGDADERMQGFFYAVLLWTALQHALDTNSPFRQAAIELWEPRVMIVDLRASNQRALERGDDSGALFRFEESEGRQDGN